MNTRTELSIDEILAFEAERILKDITDFTCLKSVIQGFDTLQKANAISYIIGVFKECYAVGDLEIHVESDGGVLKGYALLFVFHQINSVYLHSLFVKNNYRGQGIGTKLLNVIKNRGLDAYLLCDYTKNKYYENRGFSFLNMVAPPVGDDFKVSKYLYHSFSIMTNAKGSNQAPIFYLNDTDLRIISGMNDKEFNLLAENQDQI
ncbi:GNAT family N-acetyltransferase [Vibrio owensii]|uniref:GNAT family N-acetyltransferase n=1 Tax=Vibrio owensii TaxID=696485 RepID=UPI0022DDD4E9|nr:GNAT family N-acetyltransferase [Vibrio owensii]MDA0385802.1 GNAT family N-acetyltransferase [Vibrio owensii]